MDPPAPEYARLRAAYDAHARSQGIDLHIGQRTHRLFREAGLTDIHVDVAVHVHPVGHSRRPIFRDFVNNVRDKLIAGGFISRDDLESDLALFEEKLADETVLMTFGSLFSRCGGASQRRRKLGRESKHDDASFVSAIRRGAFAAFAFGGRAARAANAPGITDTEIKIGQTMPYSGPVSAYGVDGQGRGRLFQDDQRNGRR